MSWTLVNAEERAAAAPRSFFIPPAELRHSLEVGDEVKLMFRLERDDGEVAVERMWVEVVETEPYVGLLRNEPQLTGVVEFGDRVPFAAEHVCAYAYTSEELGYNADQRCFLLKRVAEADAPPPLLRLNEQGDWEAHAKDESEDELAESENGLVWTLGYLTDRFPQTAEALRDGTSRRGILRRRQRDVSWEWDGSRYVRIEG
jgi:uncharacterized protein YegJ (DUF2314 family)